MASGVLCGSLKSAKVLSCKPDRLLPAWRPSNCGPCPGTDTTFENDIDCSLFEVAITGLVEGRWANVVSYGARLHNGRPTSDSFYQSLLHFSPAQAAKCHSPSHPLLAWHPVCCGASVWLRVLSTRLCPASFHPFPVPCHSCLYPLDGGGESTHGPRTLIHQLRSTEVRWWGQLAFIYRITESLGLEKAPNIIKASLWQRPPCQPNSSTKCHIQSLNIIPVNVNFRSYWVANHICLWD